MPKASPLQSNFNGGEFSSTFQGRVEADRYKTGLALALNFVPMVEGPITRRPGSYYVNSVKDSTKQVRLLKFEFSTTQAYIIEIGNLYMRFYKDNAVIETSPGVAYELVTPFAVADIFQLNFTQSADVLYVAHSSYAPRKITRTGHTAWSIGAIDFLDGPYLPANTTATTISFSAVSGSATVTASAALFVVTDIGRLMRVKQGASWSWVQITGFTSTTVVTALIRGPNVISGGGGASANWRLGLWSGTTSYPSVVAFHEDRLGFAGAPTAPQRVDLSVSGDYENFKPTETDGTIVDSEALSFTLNASDVNVIRWMLSDEKGLLIGTVGAEWVVAPSVNVEALSPTNIKAKPVTSFGSAQVQPVVCGKSVMFVQRSKRRLREMSFYFDQDGFRSPNRTVLARHIAGRTGFKQLAFQKDPQSVLWCVRNDGVLAGMTYEREDDALIIGWHRHILGGQSNAAGAAAVVESVAVCPSSDSTREDVYLVVQRWVNGAVVRHIEYLTKIFEVDDEQRDAFFVDCGLTYDNPKTITAIAAVLPVQVTAVGHGVAEGGKVLLSDIQGSMATVDGELVSQLNGYTFVARNVTADTFELETVNGDAVDGSEYTDFVSGGAARKYVKNIAGLDHLEGEAVDICADGAADPSLVVSAGAIELAEAATTVHIGFGYNSDGKQLRLDSGSATGSAIGKIQRTHRMGVQFDRTLGFQFGTSFDNLEELTFRETDDEYSRATPLFTGIKSLPVEADYSYDNQLCWRQDKPLPCTILAMGPQLDTQDAG